MENYRTIESLRQKVEEMENTIKTLRSQLQEQETTSQLYRDTNKTKSSITDPLWGYCTPHQQEFIKQQYPTYFVGKSETVSVNSNQSQRLHSPFYNARDN